jgi:hypothetical protein
MDRWRCLVNTAMNLLVPQNVGKFLSSCTASSFSRRAQLHGVSYLVGTKLVFLPRIKNLRILKLYKWRKPNVRRKGLNSFII